MLEKLFWQHAGVHIAQGGRSTVFIFVVFDSVQDFIFQFFAFVVVKP